MILRCSNSSAAARPLHVVRRLLATTCLVTGVLTAGVVAAGGASAATSGPCGLKTYNPAKPPTYHHVFVIMEENLSYPTWRNSSQTAYTHQLAQQCGSETDFHSATHPSQPNYMAVSSGYATGVGVRTSNDNIFHQLQSSGRPWRNYAESMSTACEKHVPSDPVYKPGHTPAFYYDDLRSPTNTCRTWDVPMTAMDKAITNQTMPPFAWISPNECNGYYYVKACGGSSANRISMGESWLQSKIAQLTSLPSYRNGGAVIFVTFDEGDETTATGIDCTSAANATRTDCWIPTWVISPYITPGATDSSNHNLYTLGGPIADIFGVPRLGNEVGAGSLRAGLGF